MRGTGVFKWVVNMRDRPSKTRGLEIGNERVGNLNEPHAASVSKMIGLGHRRPFEMKSPQDCPRSALLGLPRATYP